MRKFVIITLSLFVFACASAQQLPLYSQYYFNSFIYNPSHAGADAGTSLNLVARKQFTGLANSIGTYAATLQTRGNNKKSGFGLYAYKDNVSLFSTNSLTGSYAYHIPLSGDKILSFGMALAMLDHKYNASNFHLISESDPIVALLGNEGGFTIDANAGANIDFGKLSVGLSNLQIFKSQEAFENNVNNKSLYTLAKHWMLNASYKIDLSDNLQLEPYMLYRKVSGAPGQVDLNLFLNWLDQGYAGIAYRDGMSFSTMLGVNVNEAIGIGYAFDLTTHKLRGALGNTHEIGLRFNLDTKTTSGNSEILVQEKKQFQSKIEDLENEVIALKMEKNSSATSDRGRVDTVVIERVLVKEVIKEVPVVKGGSKKTPTTPIYKPTEKYRPSTTPTKPSYEPIPESNLKFYVIAGSFATPEAANNYIYKISKQGSKGYQKYDSKTGRYYVHVGEHSTKLKAVGLVQKLKPSGLPLWIKSM